MDEAAPVAALSDGTLGSAGPDVFRDEPDPIRPRHRCRMPRSIRMMPAGRWKRGMPWRNCWWTVFRPIARAGRC
ncbi:hypothetical protein ACVDG3_10245 [Meridianimarinicoccus sp. RP-17]|uniref:hypothetical protein n=1 Tax=Meridianimarinicoccus zhengii TaxID=2056810 RepID=UPI001F2E28C3|nr:hypothetical protein [Phycocomes zhengii]